MTFGLIIGTLCAVLLLAVVSNRLGDRVGIPAPAFFLVGAAVASDVFPKLSPSSIELVQRVVTVALVAILFNGGLTSAGRGSGRTPARSPGWGSSERS